jgi:hypothetical protein
MKKGKLLILLLAALSIILVLAACDKTDTLAETTVGTAAGSGTETVSETAEEVSTETEPPKHEAHEYFVIGDAEEAPVWDEISEIDGELYGVDHENNLLAVRTEKIDTKNYVNQTISVYDLLSGEIIFTTDVSYPENPRQDEVVELDVTIDYPIIRVSQKSYSEDGSAKYDVEYYFAKKDSECIKITDKSEYARQDYDNGLVCFTMGDESVWIDKNLDVVRRVSAIATDGLAPEQFDCEYMGYLYSWTDTAVQIFNRDGVCSATYNITHGGFINVHVLDSGNVLVQDIELVDAYTPCDIIVDGDRYTVKSYVMKYLDGEMEEIELDFLVDDLATAYGGASDGFPFELAAGHDNQAYIYRFANGNVSPFAEYAVMSNDLEIEYVVKNGMHGIMYDSAYAVDSHHYVAYAPLANSEQAYLFDLDGNAIPIASTHYFEVTPKYIVTATGIFDHKLNKLFDFESEGFDWGYFGVDAAYDKVYIAKYNAVTGAIEEYLFDRETNQAVMVADGIKQSLFGKGIGDGYHVIIDLDTDKYSFINSDGTTVFVTYREPIILECNGLLLAATEFEGKTVIYVIK